jgi:hypothetical protein
MRCSQTITTNDYLINQPFQKKKLTNKSTKPKDHPTTGGTNDPDPNQHQHQHQNNKQQRRKTPPQSKEQCKNCGLTGHETTNCRTNSFHVGLYQKHLKELSDKPQINFIATNNSDHEVCDPLDFMDQTNESTPDVNIIETDRINTHHDTAYLDCASSHNVFKDKQYITKLQHHEHPTHIQTLHGSKPICVRTGTVQLYLPNGTPLTLTNDKHLYVPI